MSRTNSPLNVGQQPTSHAAAALIVGICIQSAVCASVIAAQTSPASSLGKATSATHQTVIAIRNGTTEFDLLGNGTKAEAVVAWRGNGNAHGYSTIAFYVRAKVDEDNDVEGLNIVPLFGGAHDAAGGEDVLRTNEGADCTLRDVRLVKHDGAPVELIIANRKMGDSYAASDAVQFDYYKPVRVAGDAGTPPFRFEHELTVAAKHSYCDVNEAFRAELGLGSAGLGHGEGAR